MKKFLPVMLAAVLLFAAACGSDNAEPAGRQVTTAGEVTTEHTEPAQAAEHTTVPEEITTEVQEETTAEQDVTQPEQQKSEAELLEMYNKALAASGGLKRAEYRRAIASGGLWRTSEPEAVLDLAKEEGMPALIARSETQAAASDLTALNQTQVSSVSVKQENGRDVITIRLREYSKTDLNSKSEAGYTGITTLNESKVLVKDIAKSMYSIGAVGISKSTTKMTGGTITAELTGSGRLASVRYAAKQTFDADLKILLAIDAGLTITYHISAEYR